MTVDATPVPAPPAAAPGGSSGFTPVRFGLFLAVLLVAAFPDVGFGGRTWFYRDYGVIAYPSVFFQRECFWRGELPLWNPLSNCGVPFLAQWGTMPLYPGALLYLLLPLPWSLGFFCLAHLWLAGFGAYWLARRWTGSDRAAAVAGVAFVFNGIAFSCLLWPNYVAALGWMPWVVGGAERAWREGGRAVFWAAAVGAMQFLAGVPEMAALTGAVVGGLWLAERTRNGEASVATALRSLGRVAGVAALAIGLTAVQWLPFLELLEHSQRDASFATAKWTLPLWGWANLVAPLVHCFQTTQGLFFQTGQEFFSSTYLGTVVVAWAMVGVWRGGAGGARAAMRLWALVALAGLGVVLAMGDPGLVYRGLREVFPALGVARYPVKFTLLTAWTVPLLAALGVAAWERQVAAGRGARAGRPMWVCFAAVLLWLVAALVVARARPLPLDQWPATWWNTGVRALFLVGVWGTVWWAARTSHPARLNLGTVAVVACLWLDVQTHVPRQNPTVPAALLAPGLAELKAPPPTAPTRAFLTPAAEEVLLRSRVADFERDFVGKRLALWSHLNLLEGVAKVNGSATLQMRGQAEVQARLYQPGAPAAPQVLDFLGAAHASSPSNVVEWVPRATALPRVTAGQAPRYVAESGTLEALFAPAFDPAREVVLGAAVRADVVATNAVATRVVLRECGANQVRFEVEAAAATLAVIAQSWHPAWRAEVNGQATPVWRANHAFQAVALPAGRSEVRLRYRDARLRLGGAVSAMTWLVVGAGCWRRGVRNGFC